MFVINDKNLAVCKSLGQLWTFCAFRIRRKLCRGLFSKNVKFGYLISWWVSCFAF